MQVLGISLNQRPAMSIVANNGDESNDPLISINWQRLLKYPIQQYNIPPTLSHLVIFIDKLGSTKKNPLITSLHVVNKMLQAAWDTYLSKLAKNDPVAVEYSQKGEYLMDEKGIEGKAEYLNSQENLRYLAYCSARTILDSWSIVGVQMAGNTVQMNSMSGPPSIAIRDTNREVVNYWGALGQLEQVGFILKKTEGGAYAFVPYSGVDRATPMDMVYNDVAGNLQCGAYIRIGQVQYEKSAEYRDTGDAPRLLACGLKANYPNAPSPSLEAIEARLKIHPTITINAAVALQRYQ